MNDSNDGGWRKARRMLPLLALVGVACGSVEGPSNGGSGGGSSTGGAQSGGGSSTGGQGGGPSSGGGSATSGGNSSGGGASGGSTSGGGSESGGASSGGTGGQTDPCLQSTEAMLPTVARSATFSGTDSEYSELYNQLCVTKDDCIAPCDE